MAVSFERIRRNFNNRIEEPVRQHLRNVYGCLTMSLVSAAVGTYVSVYLRLLTASFAAALPALGLILALHFTPPNGKNNTKRLGYLLGAALCLGLGMGPLIERVIEINPSIVISALVGTTLIFTCFTLSVLFAPRGYWLFVGGPLLTVLSSLCLLTFANVFFASKWIFHINIYIGLLAMCGFVIYDTTLIIEKCNMNDKDFIMHSLDLFMDFIAIFKRILIILLEKDSSKHQSENNSNSNSKNS